MRKKSPKSPKSPKGPRIQKRPKSPTEKCVWWGRYYSKISTSRKLGRQKHHLPCTTTYSVREKEYIRTPYTRTPCLLSDEHRRWTVEYQPPATRDNPHPRGEQRGLEGRGRRGWKTKTAGRETKDARTPGHQDQEPQEYQDYQEHHDYQSSSEIGHPRQKDRTSVLAWPVFSPGRKKEGRRRVDLREPRAIRTRESLPDLPGHPDGQP